jgi:hypothetical protein
MSSAQSTTPPIKPNIKRENIKKSIEFADALMSQLSINQSRHHPNRPLYYPVLMHGNLTSELEYSQNPDQTNTILKQFTQDIINNYVFIQSLINNECDLYIKLPISKNHETSEKKDNPAEFISIGKSKYIMFDKENGSNIIRKYKPIEHADVVDLLYVDSGERGSEIILDILSVDVNELELYYVNPVSKQSDLPPIDPNIKIYTLYTKTPKITGGRGTTQKKRKTKNTNQKRKKTRKRHK